MSLTELMDNYRPDPAGNLALDCHCPDCDRMFMGADRAGGHCRGGKYGGCCKSFRSLGGFDRHRTGPYESRRCLTADELLAKGWTVDGDGIWRMPAPATNPWKKQEER